MAMAEDEASRVLRGNAPILLGGFLAFFFLNVLNTSYSTLLALIKEDLALTYTMSGALMSAYFAGYTLGQIPWGFMADRHGSRRIMVLSILGIASSTVLFGFARGFWQAAMTRFMAGILGAGIFVPGVRLVSGWFPPEERGTALGILSVGGSIGLILSSWVTPLLAPSLGWRGSMELFGVLGILSTTVMWATIRDRSVEGHASLDLRGLADVVGSRSFWILAAVQMVRLGTNYAFLAWLPLLLQEEYGLSLVAAGAAFSLFNLAGMVSNPLGGFISDRIGEKSVLTASFVALGVGAFLFKGAGDGALMYLLILVLGWFINFVRSPSFAILPKLYGVERAGKVSGMQNTFASIGALVLPLLLGYIRDATASYSAGWTILSLLLVSVGALNLLLEPPADGEAR